MSDIDTIGNDPKGFNRHWWFTGFLLSFIGFSFNENGDYFNKKSVVHYLTRNLGKITLSDEEKREIEKLNDNSTVDEVAKLFDKVKRSQSSSFKNVRENLKIEENENRTIQSPLEILTLHNEKLERLTSTLKELTSKAKNARERIQNPSNSTDSGVDNHSL